MVKKKRVIAIATVLFLTIQMCGLLTAFADLKHVKDNFSMYNLGSDLNGLGNWTAVCAGTNMDPAKVNVKVATDPINSANKVARLYDNVNGQADNATASATLSFPKSSGTDASGIVTVQYDYLQSSMSKNSRVTLMDGTNTLCSVFVNASSNCGLTLSAPTTAAGGANVNTILSWGTTNADDGNLVYQKRNTWVNLKFVLNFNTKQIQLYYNGSATPKNAYFAFATSTGIDGLKINTTNDSLADVSIDNIYVVDGTDLTIADTFWNTVPLGGGGYVTGIVSNADGSAIYCRTDVGGAFRWSYDTDGVNGNWISISDTMVPYSIEGASELMKVNGICTDPNDLNKVYVGAGFSKDAVPRGIFASSDRGNTWTQINTTLKMYGNDSSYRANGERLAVDPNNSNILWCSTNTEGLYKGVNNAGTWTWTQVPSTSVPFGTANAGISFVTCDKNNGSTIVYAGVYSATDGGIYKSTDGGTSWSKVAGDALTTPRRVQITSNGILYISGGSNGGFKLTRDGTVSKMATLPTSITYHAVAVDPSDATGNTVYVAQIQKDRCKIYRSADGGANWKTQDTIFNEGPATSSNQKRKEPDGTSCLTGYWFGSVATMMVNPANANQLWLGDFFGASRTNNAQDLGTNPGSWWYTLQKGQEETCVLDVLNAPTGAKLMTGVGDVGGFRYQDDTGVRPSKFSDKNITSLDFSEGNHNVWVRAWMENNVPDSPGSGGVSTDGGVTWLNFGQVAKKTVINSPTAGWETFDLGVYVNKQKEKGNNTITLIVASSDAVGYSQNTLNFDSNNATDTAVRPKLMINGTQIIHPIADTYVSEESATTNSGNATVLKTKYYYGGKRVRSYLKFDLSTFATITSAELHLNRQSSTNTTEFPVGIFAGADSTWIEGDGGTDNLPAGEMIWNNRAKSLAGYTDPILQDYRGARPAPTSTPIPLRGGRVAVSAVDPNVMVWEPIGTVPYYSNDRGVAWTPSTGAPISEILDIYGNGNSTYGSGQPLAADRANGYFYKANFGSSAHVIYRSTDNGATFTQVSTISNGNSYDMRTPQIQTAPVSPTCPAGGDVWVSDEGTYIEGGKGGGLWRSTNAAEAQSWVKIANVSKVIAVSFGKAASGSGYTVFIAGYVGGVKGIYRSDDYGNSWTKLDQDPTIRGVSALSGDRQNYGRVFIGTPGRGVFQAQ